MGASQDDRVARAAEAGKRSRPQGWDRMSSEERRIWRQFEHEWDAARDRFARAYHEAACEYERDMGECVLRREDRLLAARWPARATR